MRTSFSCVIGSEMRIAVMSETGRSSRSRNWHRTALALTLMGVASILLLLGRFPLPSPFHLIVY